MLYSSRLRNGEAGESPTSRKSETRCTSIEYTVNKLVSWVDASLLRKAQPKSKKAVAAETFFTPKLTLQASELNPWILWSTQVGGVMETNLHLRRKIKTRKSSQLKTNNLWQSNHVPGTLFIQQRLTSIQFWLLSRLMSMSRNITWWTISNRTVGLKVLSKWQPYTTIISIMMLVWPKTVQICLWQMLFNKPKTQRIDCNATLINQKDIALNCLNKRVTTTISLT